MDTQIGQVQTGKIAHLKGVFSKIYFGKKARRNIVVTIIFLLAIGFVYYKYFGTKTVTTYEYATVSKKDIKKSVEGSGKVASISELDIQQLQNGGKVLAVYVKPGDYVKKGQIIAQLDNRQAEIQLTQAKASYDKVINGSTKEDLDISKQSVINAEQSYNIAKMQQDTNVANAKRNLLNNSITPVPVYDAKIQPNTPTISGSYTCDKDVVYTVKDVYSSFANVSSSAGESWVVNVSSVPQAIGSCGLYVSFDTDNDYSNGSWTISLPNKIASNYSSMLNTYNTSLQNRDIALINASTSIVNAQLSLNQKLAGARPEDLVPAKASYANAQLSYENSIIRAPFDGQIGAVSAAVGQQTNSQQGIATIITKDKMAEVSLNEIDVVNVKLGQKVELTFDAIPDETFIGEVSQIDTIGQTASNVVSFALKISIPNADERIKSGMSVTANIITEEKGGVLSVPSGTIKTQGKGENEKKYVTGAGNSRIYVETGLTNNVDTEIISGLEEGQKIVSKTVNDGTAKTTQTAFSLFGGGGGNRNFGGGGAARTTTAR